MGDSRNNNMMLRFALCSLIAMASAAQIDLRVENPGDATLGMFWNGDMNHVEAKDYTFKVQDYYFEQLVDSVPPASFVRHNTFDGHAFTVRSSDFFHRIRVRVASTGDKTRPWRLTFINLSNEDPVELKASDSSFVWIEPGQYVAHNTDTDHIFEIRNNKKVPVIRFSLTPLRDDL